YHYVGRCIARVLKAIIVDQLKPLQFRPTGAVLRGSAIRVRMDVPTLPLVLDSSTIGEVQNKGFKVISGAGTATITDVAVEGDEVVLTLGGTMPTTDIRVRYGLDYPPPSHPSGKLFNNTAGGNLRDATPDVYSK